ncbi:MAG: hypothetical protein JRE40_15975 [Deltaproteobacteria bacterium]|nr:hypothetical protein [Deltaproteobacteria bacterium]MBW2674625.1 hypothetical protein [Deltaproteobacteria bacterium]
MNIEVCALCRKNIYAEQGPVVENGRWYHPHCFRALVRQRIARLERRSRSKDFTVEEQRELDDYRNILKNFYEEG